MTLHIWQVIILGIVQGITEWIPVSSSGHLVLAQKLMQIDIPVSFDIALHLASVLAVIVFLREEIKQILWEFATFEFMTYEGKLSLYIILASFPTAVIGFLLKNTVEKYFSSLIVVAGGLLFTGILLFIASNFDGYKRVNPANSLLAGIFQGIAVFPGISRTGSVISSLIISGVEREEAVRFSFLLAIPAILGASLFEIRQITMFDFGYLLVGFISAFIVSFFAITLLFAAIKKNFRYFAYYCFALAIILFVLFLFGVR